MPSTRARAVIAVGLAVKPVGKPDAGNPHVRFDERGRETGCCRMAQATAPVLDSTDQGQEASCPGRHPRPAAPGHRPCSGHSGPRGWRSAVLLMATLFGLHPFLLKLYADGGYQGPQFQGGLRRIMR